MFASNFLRNSFKLVHQYPISRHQLQHSKVYSRVPQTLNRIKTMELKRQLSNSTPCRFFSSSSASSKVGFIGWYLEMLNSRPILTKTITCTLILIAADLSSQTIAGSLSEQYDLIRTLRVAGYGVLILGPSLHFWYNALSAFFPKRDVITTFKKIALGQIVYGPTMNAIFFSMNAAAQGESNSEIAARLKRDLVPTAINGLMYWPICDFITFKFVPVHLQPLVVNTFSYVWNVYLTYMASQQKVASA
ncbi:uncharacterized protein [Nicotiana tomentosiformis]|uniref:uncharacterized protein isoform X2 n=1 Tax=Nicotiana tomentosiformis TaxID=4098 RepID=UPI00051B651C|nr:PXMP2/4 family protein 4-like [Nicotiana tomentosiformis]